MQKSLGTATIKVNGNTLTTFDITMFLLADKSDGIDPYFGTIGKTAGNPILVYKEFGDLTIDLGSNVYPTCGATSSTHEWTSFSSSSLVTSSTVISFSDTLGDGLITGIVKF